MEIAVPARLTPREGRRFAFTVGIAFAVLAGILWWRGRVPAATVLGFMGGGLVLAGLVAPGRLGPVYRAWMGLSRVLGRITTPILMAVTYFLVLAPIGLLSRLLGRNPIRHKSVEGSFWVTRPEGRSRFSDLKRQF